MKEFNLLGDYPEPKKPRHVNQNLRTIENRITASYRSKEFFEKPDEFVPERWTQDLENKHLASISFSKGPQKCPGKDLTILIATSFIAHFIKKIGIENESVSVQTNIIDTKKISHAINPCKVIFNY